MSSLLLVCLFILFICLRIPIALSIGLATIPPLLLLDRNLVLIPQFILEGMSSPALLAIPFFILGGNLFNILGLSRRIWDFARSLVGHFRGGLGHVMVLSGMIFSGISGSALADAAGLAVVGIPAMERNGFRRAYAAALTVCTSVVGPMIPPSIHLVIYAIVAQESIGRLFLAGVVPGIIIGLALMATVYYLAVTGREVGIVLPREPVRVVGRQFFFSSPTLVAPLMILAGMGFGVITPTEVGVFCIAYALFLGLFYREASLRAVWECCVDSTKSIILIMFIIAVSVVPGWIFAYDGVAQALAESLLSITENKWVILILINIALIILGIALEPIPVLILTTPILLPLIKQLGIDPIHFGIIVNLNITIGIITPPTGMGLYVVMSLANVKFEDLMRACLPFLIPLFGCLLLFTFVPELSTWLPDLIMGPATR
jgi:tripartite ATP-independent transporter DctM subunit